MSQVDLPTAISQLQLSALLEAITRQAPQARHLTSLAIRQLLPPPLGGGHLTNEVPPPLPPIAPPPILSLGAACRLVSALPELRHLELPGALEGGLSGVKRLLGSAPVRGRLETLILGDLGKDRTTRLSLDGEGAQGSAEDGDDEAGEVALAAAGTGEASSPSAPSAEVATCHSTLLTLSRCDLARAVALLGGGDGAALRCLARLGLHLTLQPDPQMTHYFYVKDIEPQAEGAATAAGGAGAAAAGAGAAAPAPVAAAAAVGPGAAGAMRRLQPAYDGSGGAVLLDRLARIRQGGGGLISLLLADTVSVGFPARLRTFSTSRGAGKATAELLKALGAAGLRCRRLLLDMERHAKYDHDFMCDVAPAAATHLAPLVLGICWEHVDSACAVKGLLAALKARVYGTGGTCGTPDKSPDSDSDSDSELSEFNQELRSLRRDLNAMLVELMGSGAAEVLLMQPDVPIAAASSDAAAGVAGADALLPPSIQGGGPAGSTSGGDGPLPPLTRLEVRIGAFDIRHLGSQVRAPYSPGTNRVHAWFRVRALVQTGFRVYSISGRRYPLHIQVMHIGCPDIAAIRTDVSPYPCRPIPCPCLCMPCGLSGRAARPQPANCRGSCRNCCRSCHRRCEVGVSGGRPSSPWRTPSLGAGP